MNLDDFGDFLRSPPYFGFNSVGSEKPCFRILLFKGPIQTQIDRRFFEDYYFPNYDDTKLWNQANGVGKRERAGWRAHPPGAPPLPFALRSIAVVQ